MDSDSLLSRPQENSRKVKKSLSNILSNFDSNKTTAPKPPKKEYLRCKLIRGHKRAIRQINLNSIPKASIHKFNPLDINAQSLWSILNKIVNENQITLTQLSKTDAGPITDGKSKRSGVKNQKIERSFNFLFCKNYFSSVSVRESFFHYVCLVFVDFNPDVLCEKFMFRCCRASRHVVECMEK